MKDDIILNKTEIIKRCIERINEEYADDPLNLNNFTKQDSIILNIQRLCEACIDIAVHYIRLKEMKIPQSSRDAFDILAENKIISSELADNLGAMTGFRNLAVHNYQKLNLHIIESIISKNIHDAVVFADVILKI